MEAKITLLELLKQNAKEYGTPLYAKVENVPSFELSAETEGYSISMADETTIHVVSPDGTFYVGLRQSAQDAGKDATSTFSVSLYEAIRDGSGVTDGGIEWNVEQGATKLFAE